MSNRVTCKILEIPLPFQIPGSARTHPAGRYEVTTEEELLGDSMTPAYKRISTTIYLPRPSGDVGLGEFLEISPAEVERLKSNIAAL
jgi:hypothetical protein